MPHSDVLPLRMVHKRQEAEHVVEIIHGFTDAHEDDVGDREPGILPDKDHLVQHLPRRQIPYLPREGGGAESAAHAAAHLGGDTDGVPVVVLHQNRLNAVSVGQLPEVFHRAVQPGGLLPGHLRRRQGAAFLQFFPERLGEVRHLLPALRPLLEPAEELPAPKGGFPQLPEEFCELRQGHGSDVIHIAFLMRQI